MPNKNKRDAALINCLEEKCREIVLLKEIALRMDSSPPHLQLN